MVQRTLGDRVANFPDNQRTGALAELDVIHLFTSWGWNAGKDQIDSGYDLCVGPDHIKYKGARFMVQVKGTATKKSKRTITAPVDKARLRQYAESVLPVFIVRVSSDGGMYWVHAQEWARLNYDKLSGSGVSGVRMDPRNSLHDRAIFETYLETAFQASPTQGRPITDFDQESAFLNSLDPKLGVHIRRTDQGKEFHLFGNQEAFEAKFSFHPIPTEKNIANLRDAINFGLPREIEVENFSITGSPVFDHVSKGNFKGKLSIGTTTHRAGYVVLYAGERYSVTATSLATDANLYSGHHGLAITNEKHNCPFDLILKFTSGDAGEARQMNASLSLRADEFARRPIREFDSLRPIAEWVDQLLIRKAIFLEVNCEENSFQLPIPHKVLDEIYPLLQWWRTVSRLHLVAKFMRSKFTLPKDIRLQRAELNDLDLAYAILKGDKVELRAIEINVESKMPIEELVSGDLFCTTSLAIELQGQALGEVPVILELAGYKAEKIPNTGSIRIYPDAGSIAWLAYDDNPEVQRGVMRRKDISTN